MARFNHCGCLTGRSICGAHVGQCGSVWFDVACCASLWRIVVRCVPLWYALAPESSMWVAVALLRLTARLPRRGSSCFVVVGCAGLAAAFGGPLARRASILKGASRNTASSSHLQRPIAWRCEPYRSVPTPWLVQHLLDSIHANKVNMSSPGVEPGLSRPQRDVLTTRRWGPGVHIWLAHKLLATELQSTLRAAVASMRNITQVTIRSPGIEPGTI